MLRHPCSARLWLALSAATLLLCGCSSESQVEPSPLPVDASLEEASVEVTETTALEVGESEPETTEEVGPAEADVPLEAEVEEVGFDTPQDVLLEGPEDSEVDPNKRLFSFAILTDLHAGEGQTDYGTSGYDDSQGEDYELTQTLREAVKKINDNAAVYDLAFVAVLGDMSDSGERSEVAKSKEILDQLSPPYLPLLGNHDVWPYTANEESPTPLGDSWFEQAFQPQFDKLEVLLDGFERAPTPVYNPEFDLQSHFINFAFGYKGYHFFAIDLVTRSHAILGNKGAMPEADLHDFAGATWPWFTQHLAALQNPPPKSIVVFSHHPPIVTSLGIDCLSLGEEQTLGDWIKSGYQDSLFGFFSGHTHIDLTLTRFSGQKVVITKAAKDGAAVRIVQVYPAGNLDWNTML